ncbi:MAG: LysM domain-containing protein [Pseudomonadota bacterium]
MPWKDSKSEVILDEHDPAFRRLDKGSGSGWGVMGYAILGVGILVLSGVILYLFLGQSMSEDSEQIRMLAERLSGIESRLGMLETTSRGDDGAAQRSKRVELFMSRFENLETTVAKRMADMAQRLDALESGARNTPSRSQPVTVNPPPAKKAAAAEDPPVVVKDDTHVVVKGDTLYSISRKYGLSVDELLTLNGMRKGDFIQPGQSLRVSAAAK